MIMDCGCPVVNRQQSASGLRVPVQGLHLPCRLPNFKKLKGDDCSRERKRWPAFGLAVVCPQGGDAESAADAHWTNSPLNGCVATFEVAGW